MTWVRCEDCRRSVPMNPIGGCCSLCGSVAVMRQQGLQPWPWLVEVPKPRTVANRGWIRA